MITPDSFRALSEEDKQYALKHLDDSELRALMYALDEEKAADDPCYWIETRLGDKLWSKQKDIVRSVRDNKRTAVRSCHGIGKSFISARIMLWFLYTHPGSIVVSTAPTNRQVKEVLWAEVNTAFHNANIPLPGDIATQQLRNIDPKQPIWKAFGFTADNATAFQGLHAPDMLCVFDEAPGVDPEIWVGAEGILTSENARFLILGNPTDPTDNFANEFSKKSKSTQHAISVFDIPNFTEFGITMNDIREDTWRDKVTTKMPYGGLTTPEWVSDKYSLWGEHSPLWRSRVMGEFPEQGEDTLIPLKWIEAAVERQPKASELSGTIPQLGFDVGYLGTDESVVAIRRGHHITIKDAWVGSDTVESYDRLRRHIITVNPSVTKIDALGIGAGVADHCRHEFGENKTWAIHAQQGPSEKGKKQFANLRAELYWQLREKFQNGEISIPNDDRLVHELAMLKYIPNEAGKIQLLSKRKLRAEMQMSPDRADAVMYAAADKPAPPPPLVSAVHMPMARNRW